VQGEGPAAARGQGFRQGGADIRRGPGAEGLAAEGDTEKAAAVLAQGGPGVDRVQVQAAHALGGEGGVLALDAELQAADVPKGVVVADRQMKVRQGRTEGGQAPGQGLALSGPRLRPAAGGAVQADLEGLQQGGGPGRAAHFATGEPALGLAGLQPVQEGIDPSFGDVRVELQVVADAEAGDGIATLAPAVAQEVVGRVRAGGGHVRVHRPVPVRVHAVGDEGVVPGADDRAGAGGQARQAGADASGEGSQGAVGHVGLRRQT